MDGLQGVSLVKQSQMFPKYRLDDGLDVWTNDLWTEY